MDLLDNWEIGEVKLVLHKQNMFHVKRHYADRWEYREEGYSNTLFGSDMYFIEEIVNSAVSIHDSKNMTALTLEILSSNYPELVEKYRKEHSEPLNTNTRCQL